MKTELTGERGNNYEPGSLAMCNTVCVYVERVTDKEKGKKKIMAFCAKA